MGASLRTESELLGHHPEHQNLTPDGSRELTAQEWILVHKPESYASIGALVDAQMASRDQPCRGRAPVDDDDERREDCDDCGTCDRHRRFDARRYVALVKRWRLTFRAVCLEWLRAAPHSREEVELGQWVNARLERFPHLEHDVTRVFREQDPTFRWFTR